MLRFGGAEMYEAVGEEIYGDGEYTENWSYVFLHCILLHSLAISSSSKSQTRQASSSTASSLDWRLLSLLQCYSGIILKTKGESREEESFQDRKLMWFLIIIIPPPRPTLSPNRRVFITCSLAAVPLCCPFTRPTVRHERERAKRRKRTSFLGDSRVSLES